jgi:hypothetical protein
VPEVVASVLLEGAEAISVENRGLFEKENFELRADPPLATSAALHLLQKC